MNATFKKKVRSIRWWSHGYGVIILFAIIIVANDGWPMRRIFMSTFHKNEMMQEYAYRAIQNDQNLKVIVREYKEQIIYFLKERQWTFNQTGGMFLPKEEERANSTGMHEKLFMEPNFFTQIVIPLIWREMPIAAIYNLDLPVKVDMESFYKDNVRNKVYVIDKEGYNELAFAYETSESLSKEMEDFKLALMLIVILSAIQWLMINYLQAKYIKVVEFRDEYDPSKLIGNGIVSILIGLVILISGFMFSFSLQYFVYVIMIGVPFIILELKVDPSKLFAEIGSEKIDLHESNSEIFKQSQLIEFNWFVPVGENKDEWIKALEIKTADKLAKENIDLINKSKQFGKKY